jgi:Zn-dependent peptidase ImmA (M78 family)
LESRSTDWLSRLLDTPCVAGNYLLDPERPLEISPSGAFLPMKFHRDEFGIPRLSREGIEKAAKQFLSGIAEYALNPLVLLPTNLGYVLQKLRDGDFCTFSHDGELGYKLNGLPCLGIYSFSRRHIAISNGLSKTDPRYTFTCAHEIGHFYLHEKVHPRAYQEQGEIEIRDSARDFVTLQSNSAPRSRMEWQANRFAASILMPLATVRAVLAKVQWDLGIGRHGRIWLDNQPHSQRDFYRVLRGVAQHYNVSQAVVEVRLREMDLIKVSSRYGLQSIRDTDLESALHNLFSVTCEDDQTSPLIP